MDIVNLSVKLLARGRAALALAGRNILALSLCASLFCWSLFLLPERPAGVVAFITSFSLLWSLARRYYARRTQQQRQLEEQQRRIMTITSLTPTEYRYLLKYITSYSPTATFSPADGVVAGLVDKRILYKANAQLNKAGEQAFNIHAWAYDYLAQHQDLFSR
jgi:hypothetical protein